jgi:hypothetical protein
MKLRTSLLASLFAIGIAIAGTIGASASDIGLGADSVSIVGPVRYFYYDQAYCGKINACGYANGYMHCHWVRVCSYGPNYESYYPELKGSLIADQGACSGRSMHRVCDVYGECWVACN